MSLCVLATIGVLTLSFGEKPPMSVRDLVDAHLSGNAIHSIDADLVVSMWLARSTTRSSLGDGPPDKVFHISWIETPASERIQFISDSKPDPNTGHPTNFSDFLRKPNGAKLLRNYDWDNPQPLTPVHQGTVNAEILPASTDVPLGLMDPGCMLLRRYEFLAGGERRTLRELISKNESNAELVGQPTSDLLALKINQDVKGTQAPRNYHVFFFDPTKNYAIKKLETHVVNDSSTGQAPISLVRETVVEEFNRIADEIFVPQKVVQSVRFGSSPTNSVARFSIKVNSVNQPIAKSRAEFDFPEHVLVRTANPTKRRFDVQLWGKEGPVLEVRNRDQLIDFWGQDDPFLTQSQSPGRIILGGVIVLVVLLVGVWFYHSKKVRRAA